MSDRANGWLLIFGGLAIGLVLWLSPSRGATFREVVLTVRMDPAPVSYTVEGLHRANLWLIRKMGLTCHFGCPLVYDSAKAGRKRF